MPFTALGEPLSHEAYYSGMPDERLLHCAFSHFQLRYADPSLQHREGGSQWLFL